MAAGLTRSDVMYYLRGTNVWHDRAGRWAVDAVTLKEVAPWSVIKKAFIVPALTDHNGNVIRDAYESEIAFVNVRSDNGDELASVGADHVAYQNASFFEMAQMVADECGLTIRTAGTLFGGKKTWVTMDSPDGFTVGNGDRHLPCITLFNSHDGTTGVGAYASVICTVCANTLSASMSEAERNGTFFFRVKHDANVYDLVGEGIKGVIETLKSFKAFREVANAMASFRVASDDARVIAERALSIIVDRYDSDREKDADVRRKGVATLETIVDLYALEQERRGLWYPVRDNAYVLANAITDFVERNPRYRGSAEDRQEKHFWNQVAGKYATQKAEVLDLVIDATIGRATRDAIYADMTGAATA